MRLIEAIKEKGNPYWIPNCTRAELPAFFVELGYKRGAEIGVSWGQNLVDYCEAGLEMYGIDPWLDYPDEPFKKLVSIEGKYGRTVDGVYQLAQERLAKYPNCTLVRKMSMDALADFPDRSLDFVYVDANHSFGYAAMDYMKWTRKVRRHGVIAGHDYYSTKRDRSLRQVRFVIDAWVKHCDVDNWYVVGRRNEDREAGERFDRELSFFFFKHW